MLSDEGPERAGSLLLDPLAGIGLQQVDKRPMLSTNRVDVYVMFDNTESEGMAFEELAIGATAEFTHLDGTVRIYTDRRRRSGRRRACGASSTIRLIGLRSRREAEAMGLICPYKWR